MRAKPSSYDCITVTVVIIHTHYVEIINNCVYNMLFPLYIMGTGMGGNGNVTSHYRLSLFLYHEIRKFSASLRPFSASSTPNAV